MNPDFDFEIVTSNSILTTDIAQTSLNMKLFIKYIFDRYPHVTSQLGDSNTESDDEFIQDVESTAHIGNLFLLASLYRLGKRVTQHIDCSYYVPDQSSTSLVSDVICDLIISNQLRPEYSPAFISLVSRLYIGYLDFLRYLRIRKSANQLTRSERRALNRYDSLGSRSSWPIFTPIIGILATYGLKLVSSEFSTRYTPHAPSLFVSETSRLSRSSRRATQTNDPPELV
jgi:hypothetical protein